MPPGPRFQSPDYMAGQVMYAGGPIPQGLYQPLTDMNHKPGPRDEAKAKALIADLVEDYFYSWDGNRKTPGAKYISINRKSQYHELVIMDLADQTVISESFS